MRSFEEKAKLRLDRASEFLHDRATARIEMYYGEDGNQPLAYHNTLHTEVVRQAASMIGALALRENKINYKDFILLQVAASGHDLIQLSVEPGKNEAESARLLSDWTYDYPEVFDNDDRRRIKTAIKATSVSFDSGVMRQSAGDDFISQALCDADLASLGKPFDEFWQSASNYLQEMQAANYPNPTFSNPMKFLHSQVGLLSSHKFYTPEAQQLFPHQNANIHRIIKLQDNYAVQ